jgi:hypothetical protein
VSNSIDWLDPETRGIGSGWEVEGSPKLAVKENSKCEFDRFSGRYQYISSVGETRLKQSAATISIEVISEGCDDFDKTGSDCGEATIYVNSMQASKKSTGINVVAIDPDSVAYESRVFNTHSSKEETEMLGKYLKSIPKGFIVAIGTQNDACMQFSHTRFVETERELNKLGISTEMTNCGRNSGTFTTKYFRSSFASIAVVGGKVLHSKQNFRYSVGKTNVIAVISQNVRKSILQKGKSYILSLIYRSSSEIISGSSMFDFDAIPANTAEKPVSIVRQFTPKNDAEFTLSITNGWMEIDDVFVYDQFSNRHDVCQPIQNSNILVTKENDLTLNFISHWIVKYNGMLTVGVGNRKLFHYSDYLLIKNLKTASYLSVSGATRYEVRDAKGSRTLSKVRFNDFVSLWISGKGYINWDTSPLMISKEYTLSVLV